MSAPATFEEKSFEEALEEIAANNELDLPRVLIEQLGDIGILALRIEAQPGPAQ